MSEVTIKAEDWKGTRNRELESKRALVCLKQHKLDDINDTKVYC